MSGRLGGLPGDIGDKPKQANRWRSVVACWLLCAALLSIIHLATPAQWKSWLPPDYEVTVNSILDGHAFRDGEGQVITRYPPLFPWFLAGEIELARALGWSNTKVSQVVAIGLAANCGALVFAIAALWVRRIWALVAALATVANPHLIYATFLNLSVLPFLVCLLFALLALLSQIRHEDGGFSRGAVVAATVGVVLGAALLLRPIALLLPLVWVGALLLTATSIRRMKRRLISALILLAAMVATIAPWEIWLEQQTGQWVVLSQNGPAAFRDGISFNHKSWREPLEFGPRLLALQDRISDAYPGLSTNEDLVAFLRTEVRRDPLAVAQIYLLKSARSWYGADSQARRIERPGKVLALLYLMPSLAALWFVVSSLWGSRGGFLGSRAPSRLTQSPPYRRSGSRVRDASAAATGSTAHPALAPPKESDAAWRYTSTCAVVVLVSIAYFWGITALVTSIVRYMVPAFALLPLLWCCALALRFPATRARCQY